MRSPLRPCTACGGTGREFDPVAYGLRMKRARLKAGIKVRDMAKRMGTFPSHICDLERGERWTEELKAQYLEAIQNV